MLQVVVLALLVVCVLAGDLLEHRLPGDVIPRHYKLNIVVDLNKEEFHGSVWIKIECIRPTSTITLHSKELEIKKEVEIISEKTNSNEKIKEKRFTDNDFFIIDLDDELQKGETYIIKIPYEGRLEQKEEGFYRVEYGDSTIGSTKWYAITNIKTRARFFFPCFDEPALRATFSLQVGHNAEDMAVSNMAGNKMTGQSGEVWTEFGDTPPMSPHQVVLLVCDLTKLEQKPKMTNRIFSLVPSLISFFEEYFYIGFPLPNFYMAFLPNIEYTPFYGLIVLPEEMVDSPKLRFREIKRLAHDIASYWIGGVVSIKWWDDLWYSWALAEYMATLALEKIEPSWNYADSMFCNHLETIYKEDVEDEEHETTTVHMIIDQPEEIHAKYFTGIFLEKGPVLMRMVHMFLGDQVFQNGLRKFLKKFRDTSADYNDLWSCLTEEAHRSIAIPPQMTVQNIMKEWITQPGFPLLKVTRDSGAIIVSEKRFKKKDDHEEEDNDDTENDDHKWWVPLSYSKASNIQDYDTQPKEWINSDDRKVSLPSVAEENDWIVFNNRFAGLYRVNYDIKDWKLIADALNTPGHSGIHVLNRVQLLTDALDFAKYGLLDYRSAISVVRYLRHEMSYLPWKMAFGRLKYIKEKLLHTPKYEIFKKFLKQLLTPIFEKNKNLPEVPDEADVAEKENILKWACEFGVDACKKETLKLFKQWKSSKQEKNPLPKYMRRMIYCKGVEEGSVEDWQFLQKYYDNCDDFGERKHILYALSCTTNPTVLRSYLDWSIDKKSTIQSAFTCDAFRKVAGQEAGYSVARDFLFNNVKRIKDYSPRDDVLTMYVEALATEVASTEELTKLRNFVETRQELEAAREELEDSFNTATKKLEWLKENYEPIINAITEMMN